MNRTITNKIDAITGIRAGQRSSLPPCPKSVKIELTARCNFRCSYCARGMRLRDQKDMDRALFERLLPEFRAAGVEEIGLFYLGESFLLPWLAEAVAYARAVGFPYIFLTTNGSLANPDAVEACMKAGLNSLKFSLNYADETQFADIAGVKPKIFGDVLENLRRAREARDRGGYDCGVFASYIQYDGEQGRRMQNIVEMVRPLVDEIYALPLYSQADLVGKSETEKGWAVRAGNPGRLGKMRDPIPCWALFTEARVTHDGHLSACCFDHDGRFHMGDLKRMDFMAAWHSPPFQELRKAHLANNVRGTVCENCVAYG